MSARPTAFGLSRVLLLVACIAGCSKPTAPKQILATPSMTVQLPLAPAIASGVSVTKVDVTVQSGTFTSTVALTIAGDQATGTIPELASGAYSIAVQLFDGAALLVAGSGDAQIHKGKTTAVTVEIAYASERLQVIDVWGASDSNIPTLIAPAQGALMDNGCYNRSDGILWDFDWSDVAGVSEYQLYVKHLGSQHPVINTTGLTTSTYHHDCAGCYITDFNRHDWHWRVRARVAGSWSNWTLGRTFSAEPLSQDCGTASCDPNLAQPTIVLTGVEPFEVNGMPYRRYLLAVTNWGDFPAELFTPAPALPPCGSNPNASRAWVDIYRADGSRLYGFCALTDPAALQSLWFALPASENPPDVYLTLRDRQCDITRTSNTVSTAGSIQPTRILVDASHDGGVWWFPQSDLEGFSPDRYHQGQALANRLRALGYEVDELARGGTITTQFLGQYNKVIRAGAFGGYSAAEIAAYVEYVGRSDASLILISEFQRPGWTDPVAEALGLKFKGVARGEVTNFTPHPITSGSGAFEFNAGSVLLDPDITPDIEVLGRLGPEDFVDLNGNDSPDPGEPKGSAVMGVLHGNAARVFFLGEINGIEGVPQPLVDNLVAWAFGTTQSSHGSARVRAAQLTGSTGIGWLDSGRRR